MDTDNYIASYMESDFVLQNDTLLSDSGPKQKFDAAFMKAIHSLPGLKSVHSITQEWIRLDYSSREFGAYIDDFKKQNDVKDLTEPYLQDNFLRHHCRC